MYGEFYRRQLAEGKITGNIVTGRCPFHDDQGPSFSAYVNNGVWACFGACALKGRSPEEFLSRIKQITLEEALKQLHAEGLFQPKQEAPDAAEDDEKEVPLEEVERRHADLIAMAGTCDELLSLRGWTREALVSHKVGYDSADDRVWLPVHNGKGGYRNVRRYDWKHKSKAKFVHYAPGYGKNALFPRPLTEEDREIILCEGEPDCMLLRSWGLPAFSLTGGAGSTVHIRAARVTLLYDLDEAGINGATKLSALLKRQGAETRQLRLPTWEGAPKNADVTDWWRSGGTVEGLLALIVQAWAADPIAQVSLPEAIQQERFNKTLRVRAVASGKNLSPYWVPKRGLVVCTQGLKCCKACGIGESGGFHKFEVRQDSPKLIECADEPSNRVRGILREHLGIPSQCNAHEIEVQEQQSLYDVKLSSMIEMDKPGDKNPYIAIQAWSTENLDLNTPFILTAKAMPSPKTQAATLIITSVEGTKTSIDDFKLAPDMADKLKALVAV